MNYVHNLSPFALRITETFGIRWYGLAYLGGFICGYLAIAYLTKRGRTLFTLEQIPDFITYVALGVLVGGRLGYALFYAPDLFTSMDGHFPYWGVFKVNEGGMASHGGILGVLLVSFLYGRYYKIPFWHCQDLTVFGGSLGFFFGRIANFINGELYGRPAPEGLWWAVKFPSEMTLWVSSVDKSHLAALQPAVQALGSLRLDTGEVIPLNADTWRDWLSGFEMPIPHLRIYQTVEALIASVQSHNLSVTEALAPVLTPRYPSQLIQSLLEGLLVFFILCWIWRQPQKPGVIAAWFGTLYCLARIVGEQFRMPDAHIGFQWLGLTRGQWLSVAMLSVALILLVWTYRRAVDPIVARR